MVKFPISACIAGIKPGHALRLTITTQADPLACKALIGSDLCFPTAAQQRSLPGTYQVGLGASKINVPLARYGCFPASGGSGATPSSFRGPVRACR
ncbi:hypothetical protein [Actinocrispum sp. NPDC049592]|uniref:hypothetical protein n=1 Tax=Actinocrispum sp. NPDC049592 TaxID=3154835 RepID=UPI003442C5E9